MDTAVNTVITPFDRGALYEQLTEMLSTPLGEYVKTISVTRNDQRKLTLLIDLTTPVEMVNDDDIILDVLERMVVCIETGENLH